MEGGGGSEKEGEETERIHGSEREGKKMKTTQGEMASRNEDTKIPPPLSPSKGDVQRPHIYIFGIPSGLRYKLTFAPTDLELIKYYLLPKALGTPYPSTAFIPEFDVYSNEPWNLKMRGIGLDICFSYTRKKNAMYFFSHRRQHKCDNIERCPRHTVGTGFWECCRHGVKITDDHECCFGWKNYHAFKMTDNEKETGWIMEEYVLDPSFSVDQNWAVCKIHDRYRYIKGKKPLRDLCGSDAARVLHKARIR